MDNSNGIKGIDAATLRRLMPLWARAAGFGVEDSDAERGFFSIAVDNGHDYRTIGGWLGKVMAQIEIRDGVLQYAVDRDNGLVRLRIAGDGDEG